MARAKIHDYKFPESVLRSAAMKRQVDAAAEEIAGIIKQHAPLVEGVPGDINLPVTVHSYTTDRARATVWLAHPSGKAVQAKHGLITRAASQAGVEIKGD